MGDVVKTCRRCGAEFSTENCAACARARVKRWREANPERAKAATAAWAEKNLARRLAMNAIWRNNNPDKVRAISKRYTDSHKAALAMRAKEWAGKNPEKIVAASKAYASANPDKLVQTRRKHYTKNAEAYRARSRQRSEKHPEYNRLSAHIRRARKFSAGGVLPKDIEAKLWGFQQGLCACCGAPLVGKLHVDHVIPLSKGGDNTEANVQLLLQSCNQQKHNKLPADYMRMFRADYFPVWEEKRRAWLLSTT